MWETRVTKTYGHPNERLTKMRTSIKAAERRAECNATTLAATCTANIGHGRSRPTRRISLEMERHRYSGFCQIKRARPAERGQNRNIEKSDGSRSWQPESMMLIKKIGATRRPLSALTRMLELATVQEQSVSETNNGIRGAGFFVATIPRKTDNEPVRTQKDNN